MIEQALYEHLQAKDYLLLPYLATYSDRMAIFSQEAPADNDSFWGEGPQYGRIVFAVDLQGDPERTMGGSLSVDILCKKGLESPGDPEDIEPIVRSLIHGYFFSAGTFTVSAQWADSRYFTEPQNEVIGCTMTFDLLAFPIITGTLLDVISRLNAWCVPRFPNIHVINAAPLPAPAWKPVKGESAVYWRVLKEDPAGWIQDSWSTIWRTATVKGHIFSETPAEAYSAGQTIITRLYSDKRIFKDGESPIMVNRRNSYDNSADPLRTGQVTIEGTYGIIVYTPPEETIQTINKPGPLG